MVHNQDDLEQKFGKSKRIGEADNPGPPKMTDGAGSVATGCRVGEPIRVRNTQGGVIIGGTDFLGPLPAPSDTTTGTWTPGTILYNQPLGVNFGGILSRVTRTALMYEMYKVRKFELQCDPDVSSGPSSSGTSVAVPSIAAYIDGDVVDDPTGVGGTTVALQNAMNQKGALVTKAFEPWSVSTIYDAVNGGWLWCNSDATQTDPHGRFFGRAVVMCANTSSTFDGVSAGTLYVAWEIEFKMPSGISTIPNQGYFFNATGIGGNLTGANWVGSAAMPDVWSSGLALTPYLEFDTTNGYTRLFPLQVFNPLTGDTYVNYQSSDAYWRFDINMSGTHFIAGTGGINSTSTVYVNFAAFTGYGVSNASGGDDTLMNKSFTNLANSVSATIEGLGTSATAVFVIKIPMNCDTNAFLALSCPYINTANTITALSMRVTNITQAASRPEPSPSEVKYVKYSDGTIDTVSTQHEMNLKLNRDLGFLGTVSEIPCPCSRCNKLTIEVKKRLPLVLKKGEVDPFRDPTKTGGRDFGSTGLSSWDALPILKVQEEPAHFVSGITTPEIVDIEDTKGNAELSPARQARVLDYQMLLQGMQDPKTMRRIQGKIMDDMMNVVLGSDYEHKEPFKRIGEADKPGPPKQIFRGDQAKVHNCGLQLQKLRGSGPPSAGFKPPNRDAGKAAPKGVVQAAPQKKGGSRPSGMKCYACGKTGHVQAECKTKPMTCHACGKKGHMMRDCRVAQSKVQALEKHVAAATVLHAELSADRGKRRK